ncbi:mitochondrial ornithine carrier protein AmcA/Ort1, putative [Cordyceps militaris CM01]|uniref:Cytidine deaminase n=1 Tax=Cordyceps militaris (strain CM01) TaxID=983644 RepID=G3J8Z4_CORMM|nr:mitochondrial ornithine carrier protein AmcA/Ort1, putative [Cordyceps militaris CM01]EGX94026.1 mitochondrial ornithine carrier protein AmcA/Ort1, putative [Cordyceps militaris CM01]
MPSSAPPLLSGKDAAVVSATCAAHGLTRAEFDALRDGAVAAKATAYCPYSKFRVGAALLPLGAGAQAAVIPGCNVENASYPVGMCAERVGLGAAVAQGVTAFRALAVATDISPPASPCGMCRQAIREFCSSDMPIVMFDKNEDYVVLTVQEILPMSFGPDQLPPPGAPGT